MSAKSSIKSVGSDWAGYHCDRPLTVLRGILPSNYMRGSSVACNSCGKKDINAEYGHCFSCGRYDLCNMCMDATKTALASIGHAAMISTRASMPHHCGKPMSVLSGMLPLTYRIDQSVICGHCGKHGINDDYSHCRTCEIFNLCGDCTVKAAATVNKATASKATANKAAADDQKNVNTCCCSCAGDHKILANRIDTLIARIQTLEAKLTPPSSSSSSSSAETTYPTSSSLWFPMTFETNNQRTASADPHTTASVVGIPKNKKRKTTSTRKNKDIPPHML